MAMRSRGDETYDQSLQRTMHSVLPPILMEIADRRPADPIQLLAQRLYELRERENNADFAESQDYSGLKPDSNKLSSSLSHLVIRETSDTGTSSSHRELSNLDDNSFTFSGTKLHDDIVTLFNKIGDLFDENDIT